MVPVEQQIEKHPLPLSLGDPVELVPENVVSEPDCFSMDYDVMAFFTGYYVLANLICSETTELFVQIQPSVVTEVEIRSYRFGTSTPYGTYGMFIFFKRLDV